VIAAFAVPNPGCSSQGSRFFRVWWLDELPRRACHPAYFGSVNVTWTGLFGRRQFFTLVLPNQQCCDACHKFYEQAWSVLWKRRTLFVRATTSMAVAGVEPMMMRRSVRWEDTGTEIHDEEPERDYDRHHQEQRDGIHTSHLCRASPRSCPVGPQGLSADIRTTPDLSSF
jgi:hypothetical protein